MSWLRDAARAVPCNRGLTLIEMLVVLAIIGVVSGAAMLSLSPTRGAGVEVESRRLAGAIQSAADATLVSDHSVALRVDASGYQIDGQGERHLLPDGIVLAGTPLAAASIPLGETTAIDLTIVRGDHVWAVSFDGLRATASRIAPDSR